jgi:Dictyostelium (slime mold) repeat
VIPLRAVLPVLMFLLATVARGHAQCLPDVIGSCGPCGTCDPMLKVCVLATDGTSCDDNNACTENESCQGGTCGGGSPIADCVACQQNDDCLDSDPCTDDICDMGVCEHNSGGDGNACDDGDPCTVGDRCTDGTCFGQSMTCDDGLGCTDDSCDGGACVHQPDSDVCVAPNECSVAVCQPGVGADAQGCVATGGMLDQTSCTEDGDPCTDDRCGGGACVHTPMDVPSGCTPLVPSYRLAVSLRAGIDRLINYMGEVDVGGDTSDSLDEDLSEVAADLDGAILVLAGRDAGPPPSGLSIRLSRLTTTTTAQQRGRVALTWLRATPGIAQKFLAAISRGRRHKDLDAPTASELRRNGRILLADAKTLKSNVKNLQRTFSVFQR